MKVKLNVAPQVNKINEWSACGQPFNLGCWRTSRHSIHFVHFMAGLLAIAGVHLISLFACSCIPKLNFTSLASHKFIPHFIICFSLFVSLTPESKFLHFAP